jgi:betaine-aldehyde dehydrogenase
MQKRDKLYIGGKWVDPVGKGSIDVINASTEEVMGTIPEGNEADVQAAVAAARSAFDSWSQQPVAVRSDYLRKIQAGLQGRAAELAEIITGEVGMPLKMSAQIQVGSPIANFGYYAQLADKFQWEEQTGNSCVVREAVGVVACITPWNYPLHQIAAKVAAALAAGCTVVLKPSEVAPLNAFVLAEVIAAAGVPAGVFNLVSGFGGVVGEALVSHPDVDMVSFTGSTRAGKRISEVAAATVKRVALELGGKSAAVVLDDADLGAAV